MTFPDTFAWGVATASAQIEGATNLDGRGLSIWDVFSHTPGKVWLNQTTDIACDHYRRYKDDVAIMKAMGVQAYRFSTSWSRVLPEGAGKINAPGLDFYDRLTDELLANGITPWLTLYHWDLPYELHCRGGWLNPDMPHWFAAYTDVITKRLSDRIHHWMTINEPQCFVGLGYERGEHAPGYKLPFRELLRIGHHVLLSHGRAVQTIRANAPQPAQIGLAPHAINKIPATESPQDIAAARDAMFAFKDKTCWSNCWWLDPIFLGRYPDDMLASCAEEMPRIGANDMEIISQPVDFFGANIYAGSYVKAGPDGKPIEMPWRTNLSLSAFKFVMTPETLYWSPRFYYERYGKPICITESGMSNVDSVCLDGNVRDPERIDYNARCLRHLWRAGQEGTPLMGYFHWSLLDNFEWSEGYKERLGLVYVDFDTQQRIWKDSARWYQDVIATNGARALDADADVFRTT